MKDVRVFNLQEALVGKPVRHVGQMCLVENVTRVGDQVAFTLPTFSGRVFHCNLDGTSQYDSVVLAMEIPTKTFYINIWDSPSNHYTKYDSLEAAKRDTRGLSTQSKSCRLHTKLNPEPIEITVEE